MQKSIPVALLPPEVWGHILSFVEGMVDVVRLRRVNKLFKSELLKKDPEKTLSDIILNADDLEYFSKRDVPSVTLSQIRHYIQHGTTGKLLKGDSNDRYLHFNVILAGVVRVGKTTLWKAFKEEVPITDPQLTTIGTDFSIRSWYTFDVASKARTFDAGGQDWYMASARYYEQVAGALLCFSIEDRASFKSVVELFFNRVRRWAPSNVVCYLVGLKSDSQHRTVTRAEAEYIARVFHVKYFEVSAKTSYDSVQKVFDSLRSDMLCSIKIDDDVALPQGNTAPQPTPAQSRCTVM